MMKKKRFSYMRIPIVYPNPSQFPEWYWIRGLHDACIIGIVEYDINRIKEQKWISNEIIITLDASKALWDTSIQSIVFRNAKLIDDGGFVPGKTWWFGDEIEEENNKYQLTICIDKLKEKGKIIIRFEECVVVRNK